MIYQEWELKTKWFSEVSPTNPKYASISIGAGVNGVVTTTYNTIGTSGNDYSLEVVSGSGLSVAMSVVLTNKKITVTLGTDGAGALDVTKNTAVLIAVAIDSLSEVSAVASGSGITAIGAPVSVANFTGGIYGTPCPEKNTLVYVTPYFYLCQAEGNDVDVVWERFTPVTY